MKKYDVAIVMGSESDFSTMDIACKILRELDISLDVKIVSAHRTPERLYQFAKSAKSLGFKVIIAGAGGAAHLPGMISSMTTLPVIGVPIQTKTLNGIDSLLSILQMPKGVPVATMAIGSDGAFNAALAAAAILALSEEKIEVNLQKWREKQTESVAEKPLSEVHKT